MITTKNVSKVFEQGTEKVFAVKEADFEVSEGERVYIYGHSGAGKSTFIHILGALEKPTIGSVNFQGENIYALSDKKRSRVRNLFFGFIFQFYHLLPELNVLENVILPSMIKGGERIRNVRERAFKLLQHIDMGKKLRYKASKLSGGEAQRVAIARALINSPKVLFCDEPTGSLDSENSKIIYRLLRDISEEKSMAVIVVSHQSLDDTFFHSKYMMEDGMLKRV